VNRHPGPQPFRLVELVHPSDRLKYVLIERRDRRSLEGLIREKLSANKDSPQVTIYTPEPYWHATC
jgi:hypothetical protein